MFLLELFDEPKHNLKAELQSAVEDALMPLVASGVGYTDINKVIGDLQGKSPHLTIDRAVIMQLCDPNSMGLVKKIEGDRLYFTLPEPEENAKSDEDDEKDEQKVKKDALKHAKRLVKKSGSPV